MSSFLSGPQPFDCVLLSRSVPLFHCLLSWFLCSLLVHVLFFVFSGSNQNIHFYLTVSKSLGYGSDDVIIILTYIWVYVFLSLTALTFDPALERALLYAVGNTLVCDRLDEAKRLAWGHERHKGYLPKFSLYISIVT